MLTPAQTFEDLIVWKKAHAAVLETYRLSSLFPRHELYGLVAQIRRAAVSMPANIAEGFKKRGRADKARYFNIAAASLEEARYYVILSHDLGYLKESKRFLEQLDEVARLLDAYCRALLSPVRKV